MGLVQNFYKKYNRCIIVFIVLQIIAVSIISYDRNVQSRVFYNSLESSYIAKLNLKKDIISSTFTPLFSDVRFLVSQRSLQSYFKSFENERALISDFKIFLASNPGYDQVRILNLDGKEVIRVNCNKDSVYEVIDSSLQGKSKRDYYKKSLFLEDNQLYVSPLDLNMEHGKIELPEKAVIRVVVPIFMAAEKKGYLVVNYNTNYFLERISEPTLDTRAAFLLVNNNGSILAGPKEYERFAYLQPKNKKDFAFYFPRIWEEITSSEEVFFKTKKGFFGVNTINLYDHSDFSLFSKKVNLLKGEKEWYMVYYISKKTISQYIRPIEINFYLFLLLALIVNLVITYIFYYIRNKKLNYIEQLTILNETLEFKVEKRTNELYLTKAKLEEKVKSLMSSIRYAKKVQETILPQKKIVKSFFPKSFILYMPKDIVAGDFYWMEAVQDLDNEAKEKIIFAVADCTGHGVPGAMVSMVCFNALNKVVKQEQIYQPSLILDEVAVLVEKAFCNDEGELNDGMDVSICNLDIASKTLQWAGANNPLWIIRVSEGEIELVEYKADRQPIGKVEGSRKAFTHHQIQLQKGDLVYLFTDGLQDQFNGATNKKLMKVGLKALMKKVSKIEDMNEQREYLRNFIREWKGDSMQIDDICIMGLKL